MSSHLRAFAALCGLFCLAGLAGCLTTSSGAGPGKSHDAGPEDAGFGVPVVSVSSSTQGFGTVTLGANSTPTSIVVTNTGTAATGVLAASLGGANPTSFVIDSDLCSGTVLPAGASCAVTMHFAPPAPGTYTAGLTIAATPGGSVVLSLSGTATAPGAIGIAPATNDFGPIVVGQSSASLTFAVTNGGGSTTGTLATALGGTDSAEFAVASDACTGTALAAGQSCNVSVTFAPDAPGTKSASLTVSGTPGGSTSATLAGTALTGGALSVAGTTDAFPPVTVGSVSSALTFTVTNTGQAPTGTVSTGLTGTNASEFAIASSTCSAALAPGGNCAVTVTFDPASPGAKTVTLGALASPGGTAGVALTATAIAQAALGTTATPTSFGSIVIGQTSTDALFTIQNTGGVASGDLSSVISGTNAADFKIDPAKTTCTTGALDAGDSCVVAVTFTPADPIAESATLTVSATPGGKVAIALSGTGLTPGALKIAPTTFPFVATLLGKTTASETFTVSNTGESATGTLATSITGTGAAQFKITSDTCSKATLGASLTCAVQVEFAPTASGGASATLLVSATGAGGSVSASMSGTGQAPAKLAWAAASYPCGSTATGTSTTTVLVLDNQGDIAATAPTFASTGTNMTDFSVTSSTCASGIAARSSCNVTVTFTPKTAAGESATLTARATTGGSAATSLTGTGEVPAAFSISPSPFSFSPTVKDVTGPTQLFTVKNTGGVPAGNVTAIAIAVTGTNKGDFTLSKNTCPATLNAGGTCSVDVTFTPSTAAPESASLGVTASPGTSASDTLSGTGLTPGALSITAGTNFNGVLDGTQSGDQTFTVTNTGEGTTAAITASINAGAASPFVIDAAKTTCQGAALAGGGTCSVAVYFLPTTPGAQSATLAVTASGNGSASTTLDGTGLTAAALALSTTSKTTNFGAFVDGKTSPPITFTITNGGTQATGAISVNFVGKNSGDFSVVGSPACLAAGLAGSGSCAISLQLTPSVVGSESATVTVSGTPGGTSAPAIALSGTGYSTGPELMASPNPVDWPQMLAGQRVAIGVTVTNVGGTATAALAISATSTNPEAAFPFDATNPCIGVTLAANGGSCEFNVYFIARIQGTYTGTLAISEGASDTLDVPLNAQAIANEFTATPDTWTLTECIVQSSSFSIAYSGPGTTSFITSSFPSGSSIASIGSFAITADTCTNEQLSSGGSCGVTVEFTPADDCEGTNGDLSLLYQGEGSYVQIAGIELETNIVEIIP